MGEKSLETRCTQLRAVRVGAAAAPGQGWEPGNSLSQGSWLSLSVNLRVLGEHPWCTCTLPGGTGTKASETARTKLWAAEKSLLRREAITQVLREAYG